MRYRRVWHHLRNIRGSGGALALLIGFILFTVTSALVITNMFTANMATADLQGQCAINAARAGLNQFLADMETGISQNPSSLQYTNDTTKTVNMGGIGLGQSDPALYGNAAVRDPSCPPYPLPNSAYQQGACYITFVQGNSSNLPYSTSNLLPTEMLPQTGWNNRAVPAFAMDVVGTGVYGSVRRCVAMRVFREWKYAVTAAQQMYISGAYVTGQLPIPSLIDGNIFNLAYGNAAKPAVSVGIDASGLDWGGCQVTGTLTSPWSPSPSPFAVATDCSVGGQYYNARILSYPSFATPALTGTDLSNNFSSNGVFVVKGSALEPDSRLYYVVNQSGAANSPLVLSDGAYYLDGDLQIAPPVGGQPACGGISLQNALLVIRGSLWMNLWPSQLVGDQSTLWIRDNLVMDWGFFDGSRQNGFCLAASNIDVFAGGTLNGLVVCGGNISLRSMPAGFGSSYQSQALPPVTSELAQLSINPTATARVTSTPAPTPMPTVPPTGTGTPPPSPSPTGVGTPYSGGSPPVNPLMPGPANSPPVFPIGGAHAAPPAPSGGSLKQMETLASVNGVYPLTVVGGVLAPQSTAPMAAVPPALLLSGCNVTYGPQYLQGINVTAPLFIATQEIFSPP